MQFTLVKSFIFFRGRHFRQGRARAKAPRYGKSLVGQCFSLPCIGYHAGQGSMKPASVLNHHPSSGVYTTRVNCIAQKVNLV